VRRNEPMCLPVHFRPVHSPARLWARWPADRSWCACPRSPCGSLTECVPPVTV